MAEKTCQTCKWHNEETGECRRYPPLEPVHSPNYWPIIPAPADFWCGEYKPE